VDEIAEAADVGRMTVFNHFARKEDMFFDRDDEARAVLCTALRKRDQQIMPIETLRLLAHRLVSERVPYLDFSEASRGFVETVERSETLIARARAIRDELVQAITEELALCAWRKSDDPDAHLLASLLLATWTVAFIRAHRTFRQTQSAKKARATFLAIVDQGSIGLQAAMAGTPYA
jgi:AcrR family transcriptional regulator